MARVQIYRAKADAYALRLAVQRVNRLLIRVEREAKRRVAARSYKTGALYNSIGFTLKATRKKVKGRLGSNKNYALVVHEGARPHQIRPRRRTGMKFYWPAGVGNPPLTTGRVVCFKGVVHHPGHRSNRYLMIPLRQEGPALGFRVVASYGASRFQR